MDEKIKNLLIVLIALTPLFGLFEAIGYLNLSLPFDIVKIKAVRYSFTYLIFFICLLKTMLLKLKNIHPFFLITVLFVLLGIMLSNDFYYMFSGTNLLLPFLMMFLLVNVIDKVFLIRLSKVLFVFLVLNTLMQVFQMFYMPAFQGTNVFGLTGRLRGFFAISSISGVVTCFVYYIVKYFSDFSNKKIQLTFLIACLSIFLTMSSAGAGLFLIMIFLPKFLKSKFKGLAFVFIIPIFILMFNNLDTLSGRIKGQSSDSFNTRKEILMEQLKKTSLLPVDFGKATNLAMNFKKNLNVKNDAFIADMMYTSILVNLGYIFFVIFMCLVIVVMTKVFSVGSIELKVFFIMCLASASSQIISEMFPTNYLLTIMGAYFINQKLGYNE